MDIYDTENSRLVIGPFEIQPFRYIQQVLKQPDWFILEVKSSLKCYLIF